MERSLNMLLKRRLARKEKEFSASNWNKTFLVFPVAMFGIEDFYRQKIGKTVNNTSLKAKATDLNKALYDESVRFMKGTVNNHRLTINGNINYYWGLRFPAGVTNVPAGGFSSVIPVSKIAKDIYPGLRKIVFFTETMSQIHYNLGRRGYFSDYFNALEYPVIVFPHMVGIMTKRGARKIDIEYILRHYDELEQSYVKRSVRHIRNIVTYTKGAMQFLKENSKHGEKLTVPDAKSQSTPAEGNVDSAETLKSTVNAGTNDVPKHVEHSTAAADEKVSDSNEFTWTKEGPDRLKNIMNHEPTDEEVERSFAEARRNMMKGAEPPKHAFSYDIENELEREIQLNRKVLVESLPKPDDSLQSPVKAAEEIQDKYDEYIIKLNEMFSIYVGVILKYLGNNKIIEGPLG